MFPKEQMFCQGVSLMFWLDCSIIWTCLPKESTCATQCSNAARLPQQREAVAHRQGVCLSDPQIHRAEYERCLHNRCLKVDLMQMDNLRPYKSKWTHSRCGATCCQGFCHKAKNMKCMFLYSFTFDFWGSSNW